MGTGEKYFVGTSGWQYMHWKKRFYPAKLKKREWFGFYAERFDTVEVNYSFYKWPDRKSVKRWCREAPPGFRYTLKAPRLITHLKKLKGVEGLVKDFYDLTGLLKEKKGCHLFQLPPFMKFNENNWEKVQKFVEALDARRDNAIEFRHKTWWRKEVKRLLAERGIAFCTVAGLGMPSEIVGREKIAYLRFHGKHYGGRYSQKQLEKYAREMKKMKCKKVYAYFNNDENAYAAENAQQLGEMVKGK